MKKYFVYILQCVDSTYYTGITNDVALRLSQHQNGSDAGSYTYTRRPVILVYTSEFTDVLQAIAWEKRLKRWSRKKKEALIRREYDMLPKLASCFNGTHHFNYLQIACHTERSRSVASNVLNLDVSISRLRSR